MIENRDRYQSSNEVKSEIETQSLTQISNVVKIPVIMKTISIFEICGKEVLSRTNLRKISTLVDDSIERLDFTNVSFMSRSAADELCVIMQSHPHLEISNTEEEVATMIQIVKKGRLSKRDLSSKAKVSMTINCQSMDDLRRALLSFGL